jgi:phosphoribosylaminoimidazolecarboxamide formyltransferase/IMP cyclohydrolase
MVEIRRAILSVSDKRGLPSLARALVARGVEILSTGGTARTLADAGVPLTQVAAYTGAPEILDGRVKTLHPRIHGGLLARSTDAHRAELARHDIGLIDLAVVNLYPFEQTIADPDASLADAIENIDIGGPTMLRAAAKNFERVAVVVAPIDYEALVAELDRTGGKVTRETRFRLAKKAFAHTAGYDGAIAAYLSSFPGEAEPRRRFPDTLPVVWARELDLRYGENPHQKAAFYREERQPLGRATGAPTLAGAKVLQGKELSYNNLLDLDAALSCAAELAAPTAVIVKHTNPCGVASDAAGVAPAYLAARACDPASAFGGIVALNRPIDEELAAHLSETFLECVIAPGYSEGARAKLASKKNLRLVAVGSFALAPDAAAWAVRSVAGGALVQTADQGIRGAREGKVVTRRAPTETELDSLDFAWRVAKHVKSNAIVFAAGTRTVGIGAGQMSRIDSVKIARSKAQCPLAGSAVASDAFFPFRDGLDALAEAGAVAVIQPGGSIRDDEVIAAADEHGVAMVFMGMRHFRH